MNKTTLMLLAAGALAGCGTLPARLGVGSDGSGKTWADAAIEIAKDPKCGHTDRIDIDLGVVSKGKIFLERSCPPPIAVPLSQIDTLAPARLPIAPARPEIPQ